MCKYYENLSNYQSLLLVMGLKRWLLLKGQRMRLRTSLYIIQQINTRQKSTDVQSINVFDLNLRVIHTERFNFIKIYSFIFGWYSCTWFRVIWDNIIICLVFSHFVQFVLCSLILSMYIYDIILVIFHPSIT